MQAAITFRQIEAFYWIASLGSFSEAAVHLNTTQPGISNRVRELETRLQLQLFTRSGRTVRLTPAGRDLLETAERLLELESEFVVRAKADSGIAGVIRIGAADTVALTWLPRLVAELGRRYPRLDVELFVDLSVHIQNKLADGGLDVGFIVGSAPGPDFSDVPLGEVDNAWMCSPQLGLGEGPVSPERLASFPILTHSRGSHLHHVVRDWLAAQGIRRMRVHGCSSLATMIEMTLAGLGVSVLPHRLMRARYGPEQLVEVQTGPPLPPNRFSCIYSRRGPRSLYESLVSIARTEMGKEACFRAAT